MSFTTPKTTAFDANILEPLQKLLRLSPPIASSLARQDMFSAILQKLTNRKAVIRLNLLRIVRSICEPTDESSVTTIRQHGMFDTIESLAESDPAVLVRNMASELVKLTVEREKESSSGNRRQSIMRNGSYTSPTLAQASAPNTPTHGSRARDTSAYDRASMTPRRSMISTDNKEPFIYRPRSRDEGHVPMGHPQTLARRTSAEMASGKSRLPRTAALRQSRSSMAAPQLRDESVMGMQKSTPTTDARIGPSWATRKRENGVGLGLKIKERDLPRAINSNGNRNAVTNGSASPSLSEASSSSSQVSGRRRTRQPSQEMRWS